MSLIKQNYVKYGLIMSGLIALCLIYMEATGQNESFNKSPLFMFVMMGLPFVLWFLGINAKKKELKNKLSFKQGLQEGFKISLIFGLVSPFVFLFYYLFINPSILDYVRESYQMNNATTTMVIIVDMIVQLLSALFFGTLYAAIISFFLKSKKK